MSTQQTRPCPGCCAWRCRRVGSVGGFPLLTCVRCNTLYTAHLPTAEGEQDYGAYYHPGNLEVPEFIHARLAQIVAPFDRYRQSNRWLDVGFGAGTMMRAAAARGWSVAGSEVSPSAAAAARADGFEVYLGEVHDLDLSEGAFDVVTMIEVVEHVPEPDALLRAAAGLLRPGGALYLTTPHARGVSARLLRTSWSAISPPEHLQLFSVEGIRTALLRARLTECSLHAHAVNPYELVAALRHNDLHQRQPSRVETGYRLNEALSSSAARVLAKSVANGILSATRLGDALKVVATTAPPTPVSDGHGGDVPGKSPPLSPQEDLEREQRP